MCVSSKIKRHRSGISHSNFTFLPPFGIFLSQSVFPFRNFSGLRTNRGFTPKLDRVSVHLKITDLGHTTHTFNAYRAARALAMTVFPPPHPVPSRLAPTESRIFRCRSTAFS